MPTKNTNLGSSKFIYKWAILFILVFESWKHDKHVKVIGFNCEFDKILIKWKIFYLFAELVKDH